MNALMRRVHSVLTLCALRLFSPSQKTSVVSQGASGMGCLKSFFWLSFGISLYVLALLIFAHGFLLTRHEMAERSTCQDRNSCWVAPELNSTYKRAIIVIIDALRFDFAAFTNETTDLPYINKLPVFHDMAREKGCSSAQLFRFQADAPTTTMQRIKGFTTGSFPTFIDISNNFDSSEISEDNFIDQLVKHHNVSFLGDDTWTSLFPQRFAKAFPFPSFDVKDLHTVDNGIMRHLTDEIKNKDWRLLIAHFLGVDHCGHRYGPLHSEMTSKLRQMNSVLKSVVDAMDSDTLLLVMGDHGMTQTGDHGGATADEVNAALFVYSPRGNLMVDENIDYDGNCCGQLVQQVDIVPTLSLLLGTPIPFSNLGTFISGCSPGRNRDAQRRHLKTALRVNAFQVRKYLREYDARHGSFDRAKFRDLMDRFEAVGNSSADEIRSLLREAREMCREVWAKFDLFSMATGLGCFALCTLRLFSEERSAFLLVPLLASFVLHRWLYSQTSTGENAPAAAQAFYALMAVITIAVIVKSFVRRALSTRLVFCLCFLVFYGGLYTSNSFILSEDDIMTYLFTSALFLVSLKMLHFANLNRKKPKPVHSFFKRFRQFTVSAANAPLAKLVALCVLTASIARIAFLFRACRPEQFWCYHANEPAALVHTLPPENSSSSLLGVKARLALSAGCLLSVVVVAALFFKRSGNARGSQSPGNVCARRLLPCAAACIAWHWCLQALHSQVLDDLPDIYATFLPRCAYALLLLCTVWWIASPITAHLLYPDKHGRYVDRAETPSESELVHQCFRQLKSHLNQNPSSTSSVPLSDVQGTPAAFGLYTVVTVAVLGMGEVLVLLLALLLDMDYAPVLLLFAAASVCLLEVIAVDKHKFSGTHCLASWEAVLLWSLSSSFWWFATGHQASISSIPWNAAFVGFRGNHPTVALPALMVTLNLFASQVLHTFLLPLVVLWPVGRGRWIAASQFKFDSELNFIQSGDFWPAIDDAFSKHLTLHATKLIGCITAAFLHRRHLMVWQIFASRFLYESLSFLVVCVTSALTYIYLGRVERSLQLWITKRVEQN